MKIEQTEQGWMIRVPDIVVRTLGLADGADVTVRPAVRQQDIVRHAIAEMRGNLPDYPFDYEGWDGISIDQRKATVA